jgi:hypothetical protein
MVPVQLRRWLDELRSATTSIEKSDDQQCATQPSPRGDLWFSVLASQQVWLEGLDAFRESISITRLYKDFVNFLSTRLPGAPPKRKDTVGCSWKNIDIF